MYYNYRYNRYKSVFMIVAFILLLLLVFDSPLHSLFNCMDEFHGDEDDCDCK